MNGARGIEVGDVVADKYRIVRAVARGGMGAIFEAQHMFLGRRVALKCMSGDSFRHAGAIERFRREAKAAGALESEHIAAVMDFGVSEADDPFIVMEYVEGEDLSRLVERYGVLPVVRATNIAMDVCLGLAVAHDKGIVHRDLKPSNVIVTRRSDGADLAKIVDFGVAKLPGDPTSTQPGALLGTAFYMPPEQARDAPSVDHRADLYALGVILYEMLTGEVPHDGETPSAVVYHLLHERAVPLRERRPDLPEGLTNAVETALAPDREARFASAREFARALAPYAGEKRPEPPGERLDNGDRIRRASATTVESSDPFEVGSGAPGGRGRAAVRRAAWFGAVGAAVLAGALALGGKRSEPRQGTSGPAGGAVTGVVASAAVAPAAPSQGPTPVFSAEAPRAQTISSASAKPLPLRAPARASAEPARLPPPTRRIHFDRDNPYEPRP
jgi:serine/threonine-protein kinase